MRPSCISSLCKIYSQKVIYCTTYFPVKTILFYQASYPSNYWKQKEDDTPMRTVKTVIHTIVKCKGESVLGCLHKIQDPQASELLPYIRQGSLNFFVQFLIFDFQEIVKHWSWCRKWWKWQQYEAISHRASICR